MTGYCHTIRASGRGPSSWLRPARAGGEGRYYSFPTDGWTKAIDGAPLALRHQRLLRGFVPRHQLHGTQRQQLVRVHLRRGIVVERPPRLLPALKLPQLLQRRRLARALALIALLQHRVLLPHHRRDAPLQLAHLRPP